MRFSLKSIAQNRGLYISTFLTFLVLAYLTIFSKYWIGEYLTLTTAQKDLISKESLIIKKDILTTNSQSINITEIQNIVKILGDYDSLIKKVIYRVEFSGLAKNGDLETGFQGFGLDLKRDENSLNRYIQIDKGEILTDTSNNSIIISKTMATKLKLDINDSLEVVVLNRESDEDNEDVINIASLKVNGIFNEVFENRNTLFISIRFLDYLLKTSDVNSVIVEFYLQDDLKRVKDDLNQKIASLNLKIENQSNDIELKVIQDIVNSIYIFILFFVIVLAYRDVKILIDKRREDMKVFIHYHWSKFDIYLLNIEESFIFNISAFIVTVIILKLIFAMDISYPSIFTTFNLDIHISPTIVEIIIYSSPIFIVNLLIQITTYFLVKFKRD